MKESIGHYKLLGELGRGGMGVVYKGHDETLSREVAIKVLSDQLATDEAVVERFKREAKSMAALNDPHIIQIYYIGEDGGTPYFVMEFVDGESLSQRLKRDGRLPVAEARRILTEAAHGLATAHERGVIHRDVKPGNLMLGPGGSVKIADFGIAMVQDFSKRLTNTGEFVGTPGYLSPEVCVGQPVDHRSDIFALGIVFYEMVTGDIPFTEASPLGMMLEVVKAEIPDVRSVNQEVDERTCAILKNMIAKDPTQRYQSCRDLLADLAGDGPVASATNAASEEFTSAATIALNQFDTLSESDREAAPTVVSAPSHPIVTEPEKQRSRLPLAIAALLVLGIAGGVGYQYRDRLFGDRVGAKGSVKLVQQQPSDEAVDAGAAEIDGPGAGGDLLAAGSRDDGDPFAVLDELGPAEQAPAVSGDPGRQAPGRASDDLGTTLAAAAETLNQLGAMTEPTITEMANAAATETQAGLKEAADEIAAAAASLGEPAAAEPLQVATATEPPVVVDLPGPTRVVVVAVGDRAIAGPVEQALEEALIDDNHQLLDEAMFPDIGRFAGADYIDLPGLSELVQQNGGHILVLAQVDYLGETPLEYYGQYSTLYSVNLKVRNIDLAERRPVGRGWQQKVDFTTLNATEKAREAVAPMLPELTDSLSDFKG